MCPTLDDRARVSLPPHMENHRLRGTMTWCPRVRTQPPQARVRRLSA